MEYNLFDYFNEVKQERQEQREKGQLEIYLYLFNLLKQFIILESPIYGEIFTNKEHYIIYNVLSYLDEALKIGKYKNYENYKFDLEKEMAESEAI